MIDGEEITVDLGTWLGSRDRSWGIRTIGEAEPAVRLTNACSRVSSTPGVTMVNTLMERGVSVRRGGSFAQYPDGTAHDLRGWAGDARGLGVGGSEFDTPRRRPGLEQYRGALRRRLAQKRPRYGEIAAFVFDVVHLGGVGEHPAHPGSRTTASDSHDASQSL